MFNLTPAVVKYRVQRCVNYAKRPLRHFRKIKKVEKAINNTPPVAES